MKKNISINISGIIFHIEEDGYEVLKKYLDSINKYFSSFEDSSEILSDIESRIAEIFLTKLNEGKQIITFDDVNSLVATMGSVSDFKAAEEQEFTQTDGANKKAEPQPEPQSAQYQYTQMPKQQLYRDQARKILGGVCAGLGNYFNVDPVWIRLFFAILTVAWGFGLLIYVILWVVLPGSFTLDEPKIGRKLFRDNERKVIGGVSGGLAAYFGIDIVVIRVLFVVLAVFGGFGLVTYIVLWIVLQPAVTLTDKMQMQGEPVTLSNIESTLKKNLNLKEDEENVFVKIILFPFRLIGMILTGLGKLIYPLIEVVRVAIGIFITFIGLTLMLSVIVATGVLFGMISGTSVPLHLGVPFNEAALPIDAMSKAVPTITVVAAFIAAIIPGIMITLLGISAIAKRIVFSTIVGWSIFILFLVSLLVLSFTVPKIVYSFKEDGDYKIENTYDLSGKKAVLRINETGLDEYIRPRLVLKGYDGKDFKLVQSFESQGSTRQIAIENAKMVNYNVSVQDSVFTFDSNVQFKAGSVFRGQRIEMTLYVPYGHPFMVEDRINRIISNYIYFEDLENNTLIINKENSIECITCPVQIKSEEEMEDERMNNLSDYTELEINGMFDVTLTQQEGEYSVELIGSDEEEKKYKITQVGKTLKVEYRGTKDFNWKNNPLDFDKTKINITLPDLESVKLKGAGEVDIRDFQVDDLEIEAYGAVEIKGKLRASNVSVNLTGMSQLDVEGSSDSMDAMVQGASKLRAFDFNVQNVMVEAVGLSSAKVTVNGRLEMKESVGSKISYRGNPTEVIKD